MTDRIAQRIARATVKELGGTVKDLMAPTRRRPPDGWRRAVAMYVYLTTAGGENLSATGRAFDRNRRTVGHAVGRVNERLSDQSLTGALLAEAIANIRQSAGL